MSKPMAGWQLAALTTFALGFAGLVTGLESKVRDSRADELGQFTSSAHALQDIAVLRSAKTIDWRTAGLTSSTTPPVSSEIWVFTDPGCAHCKSLDAALQNVPGLTVHAIVVPAARSVSLATSVWCSSDPSRAWIAAMAGERINSDASACSQTPFAENAQLAKSLQVAGTPTLFNARGQRLQGAVSVKAIERFLASAALPG